MQISFVGDHQIFSLLSAFQQAVRESGEKTRPKRWKKLFFPVLFYLDHTLWTDSHMHIPSSSLTEYPSLSPFGFGLSFRPSLLLNLSVSLKFKFKFKQLHWHDKRASCLGSFSVPAPSQSYVLWPSNLWSALESGLYGMLRRGSRALCVGSDLWTASLWACQRCVCVRDSSDRVSLFWVAQTTTVLWSRDSSCLRVWNVHVSKSSY